MFQGPYTVWNKWTAKVDLGNPFPANDPGRVFRLRGIPQAYSETNLAELLRSILGLRTDIDVRVESLASSPNELDEKCATLRFQPIPPQLSKSSSVGGHGNTWRIERINEKTGRIAVDLDDHFHGLTPIHIGDNGTRSVE